MLLGGKGAGLVRMRALGLPVPPGVTIPTSVCHRVLESGWFDELDHAVDRAVDDLEAVMGRRLGSIEQPLLVSVRSGAPVSMPGMMDTVLNVGMSAEVAVALGRWGNDEHFGWDTYRRFIESYTTIVGGVATEQVQALMTDLTAGRSTGSLSAEEYRHVAVALRARLAEAGHVVPDNPRDQIREATKAVFTSWELPRAVTYRQREGLSADLGTAANVQAMVFGNLGSQSGTGVLFTRDPATGTSEMIGDFLVGGQGEDVVAGTHATRPITDMANTWPDLATQLGEMATVLEHELTDMVDIEFTVEEGTLWLLQSRVGKRSPQAALRLAVEMAGDPDFPLDQAGAVQRVASLLDDPPTAADAAENDDADAVVLVTGLAASPGRAVGAVCLDPDDALERATNGEAVILVRSETSPADVHGMVEARGLVTTLGGMVSHAAVVARSWGLPAVVGAGDLRLEPGAIVAGDVRVAQGETITVDGDQGRVLVGDRPGGGSEMPEVAVLRAWRDHAAQGETAETEHHFSATAAEVSAEDCLRAMALKGMATAQGVADTLAAETEPVTALLDQLTAEGRLKTGPGDRYLLTPEGTTAVNDLYATEAATAGSVIEPHFERFNTLNHRFKEVITSWQMREVDGEQALNDHDDADYDASVLNALDQEVHTNIVEIVAAVGVEVPRLVGYTERLQWALDAVRGGDMAMMANPMRESYHTVWFELHEEIIRLTGRNRADEAAAGRG